MTQTPARRNFKQLAGNTNHFLVTILVGLDAVEAGTASLSPTFSTSWAPHDPRRSSRRSAEFARKALVSWLVDAIDAYANGLRRRPFLVQEPARRGALDGAGQSVARKVDALAVMTQLDKTIEYALVSVLIVWRNRLVHSDAENEVPDWAQEALTEDAAVVSLAYRGLEVEELLANLRASRAPTFKEVTSLVRASQLLVEAADARVLADMDLELYFEDALRLYIRADPARRIANIWGKTPERRLSSLWQVAQNNGLTDGLGTRGGRSVNTTVVMRYAELSHRAAQQCLNPSC